MTDNTAKVLYEQMLTIRLAEEALQRLFADGKVPGFLHLSIGQEAVPVGVSAALTAEDTVSSNHRGHGHTLAKGVPLEGFFAEVLGKDTGLCRGRGGSMHVADFSAGMLGANGIVGAGIPITTGSALALKMQGQSRVAVVYFGDGALAEGVLHECLNIAALWSLPVLFVCENNGWSEFSASDTQIATQLSALAAAFSIAYADVNGNDVMAVKSAALAHVEAMRTSAAPAVLECRTTRVRGHYEGDKQDYRDDAELNCLSERDPLGIAKAKMLADGVDDTWFVEVRERVVAEVQAAVDMALSADEPDPSGIANFVYTGASA